MQEIVQPITDEVVPEAVAPEPLVTPTEQTSVLERTRPKKPPIPVELAQQMAESSVTNNQAEQVTEAEKRKWRLLLAAMTDLTELADFGLRERFFPWMLSAGFRAARRAPTQAVLQTWQMGHTAVRGVDFLQAAKDFWRLKKETDPYLQNNWSSHVHYYRLLNNEELASLPPDKDSEDDQKYSLEKFATTNPLHTVAETILLALYELHDRREALKRVGDKRIGVSLNPAPKREVYTVVVHWQGVYKKIALPAWVVSFPPSADTEQKIEDAHYQRVESIYNLLLTYIEQGKDTTYRFPRQDATSDEKKICELLDEMAYEAVPKTTEESHQLMHDFTDADLVIDLAKQGKEFSGPDVLQRSRHTMNFSRIPLVLQFAYGLDDQGQAFLSEFGGKYDHYDTDGRPADEALIQLIMLKTMRSALSGRVKPDETGQQRRWFAENVVKNAVKPELAEKEKPLLVFAPPTFQADIDKLYAMGESRKARNIRYSLDEKHKPDLTEQAARYISIHAIFNLVETVITHSVAAHFLEANKETGALYPSLFTVNERLAEELLDDNDYLSPAGEKLLLKYLLLSGQQRKKSKNGEGIVQMLSTFSAEFLQGGRREFLTMMSSLFDGYRAKLVTDPPGGLHSTLFNARSETTHWTSIVATAFTSAFSTYCRTTGAKRGHNEKLVITVRRSERDELELTEAELEQLYAKVAQKVIKNLRNALMK